MKPADDIRRLFKNGTLSTHPDTHERVFRDVVSAYERTLADSPVQPEIWRFAMRHPILRYAIAAAVVLAAVVGFGLFHRTSNTAWAIEQSIRALSEYNAVLVEGLACERAWGPPDSNESPEMRPSRWWAVANAEQTMVEMYRFEFDGVTLLTTDGHKTWKYEPQANRVTIRSQPYTAAECWVGSEFLEQIKQAHDVGTITRWEETSAEDPATGRQQIILSVAWLEKRWNGPRSLRLEFDPASKLLTRMTQWENADWEGSPSYVGEKITYYESLPDELFEFEIPAGATIVEK